MRPHEQPNRHRPRVRRPRSDNLPPRAPRNLRRTTQRNRPPLVDARTKTTARRRSEETWRRTSPSRERRSRRLPLLLKPKRCVHRQSHAAPPSSRWGRRGRKSIRSPHPCRGARPWSRLARRGRTGSSRACVRLPSRAAPRPSRSRRRIMMLSPPPPPPSQSHRRQLCRLPRRPPFPLPLPLQREVPPSRRGKPCSRP